VVARGRGGGGLGKYIAFGAPLVIHRVTAGHGFEIK
jgi:hypothetical protein